MTQITREHRAHVVMTATMLMACGLIIPSPAFADDWVPSVPIDYCVDPIPVLYQPFDYTAYPHTFGFIPDISDSSLATYTHVQSGQVDYGTRAHDVRSRILSDRQQRERARFCE